MIEPQRERSFAFSGYIWASLLAASQLFTSFFGFSSEILALSLFSSAIFFFLIIRLNNRIQWTSYELYGLVGVITIAALTQQIHNDSGLIRFIWDGLIQHYEINPYLTVPSSGELMGLQTEPIYPLVGQTDIITPFSPFLLILSKFSGWAYLASGFSVSILTTKFFLGVLTVVSVFWGYSKGLFTQFLLLILLLNPFTLFMIGQGQPLLMLFPISVLALYLWEMEDELMFWLIWGIFWFLSPIGILISLLFIYRTKGMSLLGFITYTLWWIPFATIENFRAFLEQSLFHVPEISLISSLFTVSDFLSESLFYLSYLTLVIWAIWFLKQRISTSRNLLLLTIPLFILPSDISALLVISLIITYVLSESKATEVAQATIALTITWLTTLSTIIVLAGPLSLYYSAKILVQLILLITLFTISVKWGNKSTGLPGMN